MLAYAAPAIKFLQANVMSPDPDSVIVNRLWYGSPQPSGDANIISCSWRFITP